LKKGLFILAACTLVVIAAGLYYFVKDEPENAGPPVEQPPSNTMANLIFSGSSLAEERNGKKVWELFAEKIEVDANKKQVALQNIKGSFYDEKGGHVEMIARTGLVDTETRNVTLEGGVRGVSSDGAVFLAQVVRWTNQDGRILGSGGIKLTKDDTVITGDNLESDAKMDKVKVLGNARAIKGGSANEG